MMLGMTASSSGDFVFAYGTQPQVPRCADHYSSAPGFVQSVLIKTAPSLGLAETEDNQPFRSRYNHGTCRSDFAAPLCGLRISACPAQATKETNLMKKSRRESSKPLLVHANPSEGRESKDDLAKFKL
jgi:hypothetical protein